MARKAKWKGGEAWAGDFYGEDGKRYRKQGFATKKLAEQWERTEQERVNSLITKPADRGAKLTVGELCDEWLTAARAGYGERSPIERGTEADYELSIRLHIKPHVGTTNLRLFDKSAGVDLRKTLVDGASRAKAQRVLLHLRIAFNYAIEQGYVDLNPLQTVRVKSSKRAEAPVAIPSRDVIAKLINQAVAQAGKRPKTSTRFTTLLIILQGTGLRIGEATALTWDCIDLDAATLEVKRSTDNWKRFEGVKSAAARRTVLLDKFQIEWLNRWKPLCPASNQNLVFPNGKGNIESRQNFYHRHLVPLCKRLGMIDEKGRALYSFHDFRHYRVSELIASGASIRDVMSEIGHASSKLTLDTYAHILPDESSKRRERAESIAESLVKNRANLTPTD